MRELIIRGLPASLANDAWWFSEVADSPAQSNATPEKEGAQRLFRPDTILALLLLIALADVLFWEHSVGLSLIIFSAGISAAALTNLRPRFRRQDWVIFAVARVAAALPVLEYVQTVSVLFLVVGHAAILIWCAMQSHGENIVRAILRLPIHLVRFTITRSFEVVRELGGDGTKITQSNLAAWMLPLAVGSVFLLLFVGANPILEAWVDDLSRLELGSDTLVRVIFWTVTGLITLPFVYFKTFAQGLSPHAQTRRLSIKLDGRVINTQSITYSLVLFNIMFLFQNISDLAVLWGGAGLPDGMTFATYAHSGAYPLMATSILAGIFALMSRPFTNGSRFLRSLLLLWIIQNVVLLTSALLRLDLYVEAYGLTYLRVRAGIGMFLVLVGLVLLVWQLARAKSNQWLTSTFTIVTITVFYVGSFVNFGHVIAATNIARETSKLDTYYLCHTTPSGVKAMLDYYSESGDRLCDQASLQWEFGHQDWRAWSYRTARLQNHLTAYRSSFGAMRTDGRDTIGPSD